MFSRNQFRQPFLLLCVRSEEQQRPDADRVVRVNEDGGRRTTAAEFLQDYAIRHLGEAVTAKFLRRGHSENSYFAEAVDHAARNVRDAIDLSRIELFIEKLPDLDHGGVELDLLCGRNARIRHDPIRDELTKKKPLRETERLWSGKKQFFRLRDFLLSLCFSFSHKNQVR